jgi:hypothetical protein
MTLVNDERAVGDGTATDRPRHRVRAATRDDAPQMATALARAFYDDPVFRWFSPDDDRRREMLPSFFAVFVDAFMAHGEAEIAEDMAGAALWAPPGVEPLKCRADLPRAPRGDRRARCAAPVPDHRDLRGARAEGAVPPPAVPRRGARAAGRGHRSPPHGAGPRAPRPRGRRRLPRGDQRPQPRAVRAPRLPRPGRHPAAERADALADVARSDGLIRRRIPGRSPQRFVARSTSRGGQISPSVLGIARSRVRAGRGTPPHPTPIG